MHGARGYVLAAGLVSGLTLGAPVALSGVDAPIASAALTLFVDDAAAQLIEDVVDIGDISDIRSEDCGILGVLCNASESDSGDGGDARSSGGDGGDGGFANVHDVGNAHADATSSVTVDDVTTGDAVGHAVNVDARGATDPVVVLVAGSFPDTGVDVFAPAGNAQAGPAGGNGITADASGGAGGDATSQGGNGGDNDSCPAVVGCLDLSLDLDLGLGLDIAP